MYSENLIVKDEHIDFQGVVDGLYYPFYMEDVRHRCLESQSGINMKEWAEQGQYLVLTEYTLKFKRSLLKGMNLKVTCELMPIEKSKTKFGCKQKILVDDVVYAEAIFSATCVPEKDGRPYIPEEIKSLL